MLETQADTVKQVVYATSPNARSLVIDAGGDIVRDATEASLSVLGEELRLPVILFTHENIAELIASTKASTKCTCHIGEDRHTFVALKKGKAEIGVLYADQENPKTWEMDNLVELIVDCITLSESLGGKQILIHAPTSSGYHEAFRDEEDVYHLFIRTIPTGVVKAHYPKEIFELSVLTQAGYYEHFYPVPGRGEVLSDGSIDVVQIVGNNVFLLFDPFNLFAEKREVGFSAFRKSLVLALNHLLGEKSPVEAHVLTTPTGKGVDALVDSYTEGGLKNFRKEISELEHKVKEKEEQLAILRDDLRAMTRLNQLMRKEDVFAGELRARLLSDHARICARPLVEKAFIIPEVGYEVETKQICITHEGVTRKIGRYALRFLFNGRLFIATLETHHEKSVPHPHISAWNGPCFGNVRRTIDEACREYRYADAVEHIIDWLTNGYTPELIIYNWVEEWPEVTQTNETEMEAM